MKRRKFVKTGAGIAAVTVVAPTIAANTESFQGPEKDTVIFIDVDTDGITPENVNQMITMSDNRESRWVPGNPKNFESKVDKGKKVIWRGRPAEQVRVTMIEQKPDQGDDIMKKSNYRVRNNQQEVVGQVKNNATEGVFFYNLYFTVNGQEYMIDPKLKL